MSAVTDAETVGDRVDPGPARAGGHNGVDIGLLATLAVATVAGLALVFTARTSALALLVAAAIAQAAFAVAWVFGTGMPGRRGGLVIAALAGGGADVAASVWPHGRLGALVAVLGLAVPVLFVHQLSRGAARVNVVASLSAVSVLVLAEVSLPALLQLRHEFTDPAEGGRIVAAAAGALAAAIVVGCLVDLVVPAPRFDTDVPRGLLGVVAGAGVGGAVSYLLLRDSLGSASLGSASLGSAGLGGGRSVFIGAALGALAGLVAIAVAFVLHGLPEPASTLRRNLRPAVAALLPMFAVAPVAFLLCLAIRN